MATRRGFLATLLAASTAPTLGWAAVGSPAYLAAAKEPDGSFALFGLSDIGEDCFRVPLPARGHAGAGHPTRAEAVVCARRPGYYALVIDCTTGAVKHQLTPPDGRQFNGHGVYAEGGDLLLTSEQVAEGSDGIVGLWETATYTRIGEFSSGGLGPHDMRLMADGKTLVVANTGIETDPSDRTMLNIDTMRSNLSYLDTKGSILDQVELDADLQKDSIRHLALTADGLVAFAMQWQGDLMDPVPLLGLHRRGQKPILASAPLTEQLVMKGYAEGVAFSGDGTEVGMTSPRGGKLHRFSPTGEFLGSLSRLDVSGLAPHDAGLLASDGAGGLMAIDGGKPVPLTRADRAWDNHIVAL